MGIAGLVVLSDEESPDHDVINWVMNVAEAGKFKMEVVERTLVIISRLSREPVGHGKVRCRHGTFTYAGAVLIVLVRIQTCAELQAPKGGWIMAWEHCFESFSIGKAIDTRGWREYRCTQLLPEPGVAAIALERYDVGMIL